MRHLFKTARLRSLLSLQEHEVESLRSKVAGLIGEVEKISEQKSESLQMFHKLEVDQLQQE